MQAMRVVVTALSVLLVVLVTAGAFAQDPGTQPPPTPTATPTAVATPVDPGSPPDDAEIAWHHSKALGRPFSNGRLVNGVQLPALGEDFFTWDPVYNRIPNRPWRRWGTDRLIRLLMAVIHDYRTANDSAQRVGIMDLSRPHGGPFGRNYGGLGHASHQNGLDADVLYPRKDGTEARATKPSQVDLKRSQDLLDRFVKAGAQKIFVGPHLRLHGPKNVVVPLVYHDDHMHVRIP